MYKYIYEFKFAVAISDDVSPEKGLEIASQNCEILYGFKPSIWFCDILKLNEDNEVIQKFFYNPNSSSIHRLL